jgi:hypothetical protein
MSDRWVLEASLGDGTIGRVEFFRLRDRVAHRVIVQRDAVVSTVAETTVWESIEGDDLQHWPASPAYQEVSIETIGDRDVALLVGMAGKSHWSLSVDIDADRGSIRFDAACRIAVPPESLGSTYNGPADSVICDLATKIDENADSWCAKPETIAPPPATIRWAYEFRASRLALRE